MAQSVIWSSAAFEDLEAVTTFIAKDSTHYAAAFALEVLEASRALTQFKDRGRIVPNSQWLISVSSSCATIG